MAFTVSHTDPRLKSSIAVARGNHYYADSNLHRTMIARWVERQWSETATNGDHRESEGLLHRIAFRMARDSDEATPMASLEEKLENSDSSLGSRGGHMARNSIIYMLMCFDMFAPLIRNGIIPALPDTFLSQQWNGRAVAYDLYLAVKQEGGIAWESLCQLIDEMDDRVINEDDVLSPHRQLIRSAQKLPSVIEGIPTNIYDPRFDKSRRKFYSNPQHTTLSTQKYVGGPSTLPAWSNIAENTVKAKADPEGKTLHVWRSNPLQVRCLDDFEALAPFVDKPSEHWPGNRDANLDVFVAWREKMIVDVRKILQRQTRLKGGLERLEGGFDNDTSSSWIGLIVANDS